MIVGILGTTLAQFQVLGQIPLKNLLKNVLHQDRASTAAFFFWMTFAWYLKPFVGVISDAVPLFGTRRRSYMLIGSALAVGGFIALFFTPRRYYDLLLICTLINVFMVVTSTAVGGYMVEAAQTFSASGRLTAVRNFVEQFSILLSGPAGGFLGAIAFTWTAVAGGAIMLLVVPTTLFFLHEQRKRVDSRKLLHEAGRQMKKVATAKTMWAAAAFSALFYFAPAFQTGLFYRQQNFLHLTTQGQGFMYLLNGSFGVLAATLYGVFFCRRFTLRKLLFICIALGAASQYAYFFYTGLHRAYIIESFWGLGWTAADMSLMDLAVRATPAGSEGLGFALMMSVRNLSLFGSDWIGSKAMEVYHIHFRTMMLIDGTISLVVVPFIFLLPKLIVDRKDSEEKGAMSYAAVGRAALEE